MHLASDVTIQLDGFEIKRRDISTRIISFFKVITLSPQSMCRLLHVNFQTLQLLLWLVLSPKDQNGCVLSST